MTEKPQSVEIRLAKLEFTQSVHSTTLDGVIDRVKVLEDDKTEHIGILTRLRQTVETLAGTVSTLSHLTKELDKRQEVFMAKFNIIIGILSAVGAAIVAGVVKLLFFTGGSL